MLYHALWMTAATLSTSMASVQHLDQIPIFDSTVERVPGVNNITFCTVPRSEQLFHLQFMDIAPLPIPVDQMFFTYIRGWVPANLTGLDSAKFQITTSAYLDTGEREEPQTYEIPLATFGRDDVAHILIRYPGNKFGGPLHTGVNEILTDYWLPGMFVKSGNWTFKAEAILPAQSKDEKDRYLFAMEMTQWLNSSGGSW